MLKDINIIILLCFVIVAAYFDLKERKIPNVITLPIMLWGIVSSIIINGLDGLLSSILGFLLGFVVFVIPFAVGAMGGGDVKMMAAIGAMLGWRLSFSVLVYTALAGGIIVLIIAAYKKQLIRIILATLRIILKPILKKIWSITSSKKILEFQYKLETYKFDKNKEYIPYGLALAIGTILTISGIVPKIL